MRRRMSPATLGLVLMAIVVVVDVACYAADLVLIALDWKPITLHAREKTWLGVSLVIGQALSVIGLAVHIWGRG